ncbi:MAG: hypothetical protein PHC66_03210 [Candidatus Nanoarchaeia archaeon]|nr:hypothetical protein [Candidatus Nanoarchaeia archaeon]MDD5239443.1 hypothetical protein [Candidatus Nanoarchaeia archaeon]
MLNKRAYLITPIIFITLFLIAIIFTIYLSKIDANTAEGIRTAASIEKGVTDVYKAQIEQINFAKLAAYECSDASGGYNDSIAGTIENCINSELNLTYGNFTWNSDITNSTPKYYLNFNLSAVNITNINMTSNVEYIKAELNSKFLNPK